MLQNYKDKQLIEITINSDFNIFIWFLIADNDEFKDLFIVKCNCFGSKFYFICYCRWVLPKDKGIS